jgi:hypothetical protein
MSGADPIRYTLADKKRTKSSDIMAYFTGSPDGSGVAHDDAAKKIAQNAYEFTQKRMRWVDMQSYTLLLALEVSIDVAAEFSICL